MNSGEVPARLGLPGVPKMRRDHHAGARPALVEMTGGRYHAATISCAESLAVIRSAKARGLPVTCGVSINHLTLNENDIGDYRTFFKLRRRCAARMTARRWSRRRRRRRSTSSSSSHDPQDAEDKRLPFAEAAHGAVGLETLLPAAAQAAPSGTFR